MFPFLATILIVRKIFYFLHFNFLQLTTFIFSSFGQQTNGEHLRFNCGGDPYNDTNGNFWDVDWYIRTGGVHFTLFNKNIYILTRIGLLLKISISPIQMMICSIVQKY
jgi:hypothetical protein